jgi:hypothetical protein
LFHRTKVSARAREGIPFAVRRISALLAVLGLSLVAGCLDTLAGADSDAAAVTKIEITASSGPVIGVGQSVEFSARVRNDGTWTGSGLGPPPQRGRCFLDLPDPSGGALGHRGRGRAPAAGNGRA